MAQQAARRRTRPRKSASDRGYDAAHRRLRAEWKPRVDAGLVSCHAIRCLKRSRRIIPGTPWHLGHTPDRSGWTGPEHEQCNESEAATRGNRMRGQRRAVVKVQVRGRRPW